MISEIYRRVADRVALLHLKGIRCRPKDLAEEFGLDYYRLRREVNSPSFKNAVSKAMKEQSLNLEGKIDEERLKLFGDENLGELKRSFETLVAIRDSDSVTKGDEVRRKAAVNIIEFFLALRAKQVLTVKEKIRARLPRDAEKEMEILLRKEVKT